MEWIFLQVLLSGNRKNLANKCSAGLGSNNDKEEGKLASLSLLMQAEVSLVIDSLIIVTAAWLHLACKLFPVSPGKSFKGHSRLLGDSEGAEDPLY